MTIDCPAFLCRIASAKSHRLRELHYCDSHSWMVHRRRFIATVALKDRETVGGAAVDSA